MVKKWVRAIVLIALAVILTIFGVQLFNMLPSFASALQIYWLLYTFLWFAIFALFVWAGVNIMQSIFGRTRRLRLSDINHRIDIIEENIASGKWRPAPLKQTEVIETPPPPDGLPSRNAIIAVLIIFAILVITPAIIGLTVFQFSASGAGGATPEQAFDQFIHEMNEKNAAGTVDQTIFKFSNDRLRIIFELEENFFSQAEEFVVTVNYRNVILKEDIPADIIANITTMSDEFETEFGIEITDYCAISFNVTIDADGQIMHQEDRIPVFLVGSAWYLMFSFGDDMGPPNGSEADIYFEITI